MDEHNNSPSTVTHATTALPDEPAFRRKWRTLIVSLPIVAIIIGCWLFGKERPVPGQEAQFWIFRLEGAQGARARQELLAMGSEALPALSEHSVQGRSHARSKSAYAKLWLQSPRWATKILPYPNEFIAIHLAPKAVDVVAHEILNNLEANGAKAVAALPVLDELAGNTNSPYQLKAGFAAWTIRGQRGELVPLLKAKLRQSSTSELQEATGLSTFLGARGAPLTGDLVTLLTNADIDVARSAASALGYIGPGARAAVPALLVATDSPDTRLRVISRGALERIDAAAFQSLQEQDAGK